MSPSTHRNRLPYADPATLREMRGDCEAARAHLRAPSGQRIAPTPHRPTRWDVPDGAARMAGAIHLHLS